MYTNINTMQNPSLSGHLDMGYYQTLPPQTKASMVLIVIIS
jgi:hypothetical protein